MSVDVNAQPPLPLPSGYSDEYRFGLRADGTPTLQVWVMLSAEECDLLTGWFDERCELLQRNKWEEWNRGDMVLWTLCCQIDTWYHRAFLKPRGCQWAKVEELDQLPLGLPSEYPEEYRFGTHADGTPTLRVGVMLSRDECDLLNQWFDERCEFLQRNKWKEWNRGDMALRTLCCQIDAWYRRAFLKPRGCPDVKGGACV